ncbi:hypothetical protein LO762_19140 [Actinocorallia sp. API 0066]|uniref:hypothetical protein n=1 Tax=Actinocorallia sp. API 0066 TaxID=2896846 RepID=UPI001E4F6983|nr:hypothetical protein [Actinocorallia sp. API 0066]MCD0451297.1 hypothetical protein [Actinocorallia sp. API 0066]
MTELLTRPGAQGDDADEADLAGALVPDETELPERLPGLLAGAVDPLEVAAALEAEGFGDRAARRYGFPDVFTLGERLYAGSIRRPPRPVAFTNPWAAQAPVWRTALRYVLRGALFGMPGLGYVAAGPLLARDAGGLVLTLSLVLCWPVAQGVAALAYTRTDGARRRVLALGVLLGTPALALVAAALGLALGAGWAVVAVACAQSFYLLAATAALVTGAEVWLLACLLPGAATTAAGLAWQLQVAGWAVTGLSVAALAHERTREGTAPGVSWIMVRRAVPYAAFGLVAGGLLTFTIVASYAGHGPPAPATSAAMVALSVAMGPAEWLLTAYRARGHALLHTARTPSAFAKAARTAFGDLLARFLLVLAVLLGLAVGAAGPTPGEGAVVACFLLLGGALVVALMLQSFGETAAPVGLCGTVLAAETAVLLAAAPDPGAVQLSGAAVLFAALLGHAVVVLGRATTHR